jgi:hypothetical protein
VYTNYTLEAPLQKIFAFFSSQMFCIAPMLSKNTRCFDRRSDQALNFYTLTAYVIKKAIAYSKPVDKENTIANFTRY